MEVRAVCFTLTKNFNMPILDSVTLDHCAYVVPDLNAAVQFFTQWLGFELESEKGPVSSPNDDHITRTYAMPRNASGRWAFVRQGNSRIGLVEWQSYGSGLNPLRESSVPGCCIALRVSDLAGTVAELRNIPRMNFLDMSDAGFVYAITPYGFQIQLIGAEVAF